MKKLLILLFAASAFAEDNPYNGINKRNAFELTANLPKPALPPVSEILKPTLYLTGLTHFRGIRKVYLVVRKSGEPDKFVSLTTNEKQYNVELKKINKNSALMLNNGIEELISFENNGLPTIVTKAPAKKVSTERSSSRSSRGREESKKEDKKSAPAPVNERRRQYDEWKKRREGK